MAKYQSQAEIEADREAMRAFAASHGRTERAAQPSEEHRRAVALGLPQEPRAQQPAGSTRVYAVTRYWGDRV